MEKDKPIHMMALQRQEAPDGRRLEVDAEFDVYNEQDALVLVEKGLARRLSAPAKDEAEEEEGAKKKAQEDAPWTLQLSPEDYLERFPDGSHAAQAKAEMARRGKSGAKKESAGGKKE